MDICVYVYMSIRVYMYMYAVHGEKEGVHSFLVNVEANAASPVLTCMPVASALNPMMPFPTVSVIGVSSGATFAMPWSRIMCRRTTRSLSMAPPHSSTTAVRTEAGSM